MKYMKCLLIIGMLLSYSICSGQLPKPLEIRDFQGMNTRIPDFSRPSNIPLELINIDLRKNGSYGPRKGYDAYYTPADIDSIIGIKSIKFSNDEERMLALVDPSDSEWGKIIAFDNLDMKGVDSVWVARTNCMTSSGFSGVVVESYLTVRIVDTIDNFSSESIFDIDADFSLIPDAQSFADTLYNRIDDALVPSFAVAFDSTNFDSTTYIDTVLISLYWKADQGKIISIFYGNEFDPNCMCGSGKTITPCSDFTWKSQSFIPPSVTTIFDKMPITKSFDAEVINDRVFFASGANSQVVWDRERASIIPPIRAGELWAAPVDNRATENDEVLDGSYYYAVGVRIWYDSATYDHYKWREPYVLTGPVVVDSGTVNLFGLQNVGDVVDTLGVPDSADVFLFRTLANPEPLNDEDTLFEVYRWSVGGIGGLGDVYPFTTFRFDTLNIIDSLCDSDIRNDSIFFIADRTRDLLGKGNDNAGADDDPFENFYGGPYYVDNGSGTDIIIGWDVVDADSIGVAYAVAYRDTITGAVSDFGPFLKVLTPTSTPKAISPTITAPPPNPTLAPDCVVDIYRAPLTGASYMARETGSGYRHFQVQRRVLCEETPTNDPPWTIIDKRIIEESNGYLSCGDSVYINAPMSGGSGWIPEWYAPWMYYYRVASEVAVPSSPEFYLAWRVDIDAGDEWDDNITQQDITDEPHAHPIYNPSTTPAQIEGLLRVGDRLVGYSGNRMWWADLGNNFYWGAYNNIQVGVSSGSNKITGAYVARGVIRTFGEEYSYSIYGDNWQSNEVSGKWGCMAPKSLDFGIRGAYFLSREGVVHETEGGELERKYDKKLISSSLTDIEDYPRDVQRKAIGTNFDNKFLLSFPDSSLTWVWDELNEGWSRWTFAMGGSAVKKDTMFFFESGGQTIYSYGTSCLDAGNPIDWSIKFAPMFSDRDEEMVTDIGIWVRDTSSTIGCTFLLYGPNNDYDSNYDGIALLDFSQRHSVKSLRPYSRTPVSTIMELRGTVSQDNASVFIDGVDVYYKKINVKETQ